MTNPTPALQHHWKNLENESDAKKYRELQQLNLFDEQTFYRTFLRDLQNVKKEVIIYSPFVSKYRAEFFRKSLKELQHRNIALFIFTRPVEEHENIMRTEVTAAIRDYESFGAVITYLPGRIHEKVAIIDREILWEGSLNILSQRKSREMMRRLDNSDAAMQMINHLRLNRPIADAYQLQYERLYRELTEHAAQSIQYRRKFLGAFVVSIIVAVLLFIELHTLSEPLATVIKLLHWLN